jgi:hypothetical protein
MIMKKVFLLLLISVSLFAQTKLSETDSIAVLPGRVFFAVQDDSAGYNVWKHIHWWILSRTIKDSADVWNAVQTSALLDTIHNLQNYVYFLSGKRWIMGSNIMYGQISLSHLTPSLISTILTGDTTSNIFTRNNTWEGLNWFDTTVVINGDAILLGRTDLSGAKLILPFEQPADMASIWFDQADQNGKIKYLDKFNAVRSFPTLEQSNTYTGAAVFNSRAYASQDSLSAAEVNINWSNGNSFIKVLTGNTTLNLSNTVDGQNVIIAVSNPSTYTLSWTADVNIKWSGDKVPVQTTGNKTDIYSFIRLGDAIYGTYKQNF